MNSNAVEFAKQLLEQVLLQQTAQNYVSSLFSYFGKVALQDSTTLGLPQILSKIFPGNYSRGEQKAVARIQSIIDIKRMKFINFRLGAFTENDQSASGSIVPHVKKGDLVIRDLGYFALKTFKELIHREVYFLSRLKFGVGLFDKNGTPLNLKKLLDKKKTVDRWVFVGTDQQVRVRLVMIPLSAVLAAEKRRKARQDRDRRCNHSQLYYQWLGYSIFITTVDKDIWTTKEVDRAYRVRWQIEIIFKSWKTGFHLQDMFAEGASNEYRVNVSIYLMLLFMCLFMNKIYVRCKGAIENGMGKQISLLRLATFVANFMTELFSVTKRQLMELVDRYCCYEIRSDRLNMTALYENL